MVLNISDFSREGVTDIFKAVGIEATAWMEKELWNRVYDNAAEEVAGRARPDRSLNALYLETRADLLRMMGYPNEAERLDEYAVHIRGERE